MLKKYTDLEIQDYAAVLHLKDNYKISEKKIDENDWLANKTLIELDLRHEGITILGIDRIDTDYFGSPSGDFKLLPEDMITVYGKAEGISNVYARKKDYIAEMQHEKFVKKEIKRQEAQDPNNPMNN
jgi:Trk K+ transport system NAD-binding subunit